MKLKEILNSQAIRLMNAKSGAAKPVVVHIVRALEHRYGFLQVPQTLAEYDVQLGISFLRGSFEGATIEKFQIYNAGLLAAGPTPTEVCDRFLDDLIAFVGADFKFELERPIASAYTSSLEFESPVNLAERFKMFADIGDLITQILISYGQSVSSFELSGLKLHADVAELPLLKPTELSFERRSERPYASSTYFSAAPLRTNDHIRILEMIESLISG